MSLRRGVKQPWGFLSRGMSSTGNTFHVEIHSSGKPSFKPSSPKKERKAFGSFHSEDIEVLIRQSDAEFSVPKIHDDIHASTVGEFLQQCPPKLGFGHDLANSLFHFDPSWIFINHGAFGGATKVSMKQAFLWRLYCESQPLRFFDRDLFPLLAHNVRTMAKFLHCPATELLPLQNVTTGLNAIFQSIDLQAGDEVVCLSLTYGSTKKMLKDLAATSKATLKVVELTLPVTGQEAVIEAVRRALSSKTKLVVLDHITSNTAMELPVLDLAAACKAASPDVKVVVDAAHVLFTKPVSIYATSKGTAAISDHVDFWLTNAHKWFSAPKGAAFMWVSPRMLGQLRPAIVSHGFQADYTTSGKSRFPADGKMLSAFAWDGCRDYAALLSTASGLQFWDGLASRFDAAPSTTGDKWDVYRIYIDKTLSEAEDIFKREWNLREEDFACPPSMRQGVPMRLIPLPPVIAGIDTRNNAKDKDAFSLQEALHKQYHIEVPVKCLEGKLYVRVSAHIYNSAEQYQALADMVKALV